SSSCRSTPGSSTWPRCTASPSRPSDRPPPRSSRRRLYWPHGRHGERSPAHLPAVTNVVIVGAGKGGRALLEMLVGDGTVTLLGIADLNAWAPGIEFARRVNVPISTDFRELVKD